MDVLEDNYLEKILDKLDKLITKIDMLNEKLCGLDKKFDRLENKIDDIVQDQLEERDMKSATGLYH